MILQKVILILNSIVSFSLLLISIIVGETMTVTKVFPNASYKNVYSYDESL